MNYWSHKCSLCERIFTNTVFQPQHYLCDDCMARREALKLPQATAVGDPYLGMPMTHDRDMKLKPSRIEEPHAVPEESLMRGQAKVARQSKNRALLKRWKKRA